jgi:hypothetical protein
LAPTANANTWILQTSGTWHRATGLFIYTTPVASCRSCLPSSFSHIVLNSRSEGVPRVSRLTKRGKASHRCRPTKGPPVCACNCKLRIFRRELPVSHDEAVEAVRQQPWIHRARYNCCRISSVLCTHDSIASVMSVTETLARLLLLVGVEGLKSVPAFTNLDVRRRMFCVCLPI